MSRKRLRTDRGQILVVFAGGLVVLLVIGALVIDLGFAFVMRRHAQDVADPAAIAAARYIRAGGGVTAMQTAACYYAHQNGLFGGPSSTASCVPANDPDGTTLTVNYPPSASAGNLVGRMDMVEVVISRNQPTFLAMILGIPAMRVTSSAVAAFSDGDSNTNSLVALDPGNHCTTGRVHGGGGVTIHAAPGITGGYVHVNSTCGTGVNDGTCGSSSSGALVLDGGGTIVAPHTFVSGTCKSNSTGLTGPLTEGAVQIGDPLAELPPPSIAGLPAGRCGPTGPISTPTSGGCEFKGGGTVHLEPGVYYGSATSAAWDIKSSVTLELASGIYILAGGGIKLSNNGSITSVQGASGAPVPVLIFNTDNPATHSGQANIDFNASGSLKLRGMDTGPYRGIVVWNDGNGSNPGAIIDLKGQSSLDVAGTIYSPKGLVNLEGGASGTSTAAIQIIAWQFDVGGTAHLDMPYDPSQLYRFPQKGLVR